MENMMTDLTPNVKIVLQFVQLVQVTPHVLLVLLTELTIHLLVLVLQDNLKKNNMVIVKLVVIDVVLVLVLIQIVQFVLVEEKITHLLVIVNVDIPKLTEYVQNVMKLDVKIVPVQ